MTHDERISSYIDNELTPEMEQEFLISLAASDGLRRSFRSELVLQKVLHLDEAVTAPPREMRAAIFATVGLGAAALGASKANAAQVSQQAPAQSATQVASHGFLKTLFATKINALLTAAGLSLSALAGYGVHSATSHEQAHTQQPIQNVQPSVQSTQAPTQILSEPAATQPVTKSVASNTNRAAKSHPANRAIKSTASAVDSKNDTTTPSGVSGSGDIQMNSPKVGKK